jgi:hypothetical protein
LGPTLGHHRSYGNGWPSLGGVCFMFSLLRALHGVVLACVVLTVRLRASACGARRLPRGPWLLRARCVPFGNTLPCCLGARGTDGARRLCHGMLHSLPLDSMGTPHRGQGIYGDVRSARPGVFAAIRGSSPPVLTWFQVLTGASPRQSQVFVVCVRRRAVHAYNPC